MPFGYDEHMRGRLRIDVLKRIGVLVFVNFPGRQLALDDPAEKTVVHLEKVVPANFEASY